MMHYILFGITSRFGHIRRIGYVLDTAAKQHEWLHYQEQNPRIKRHVHLAVKTDIPRDIYNVTNLQDFTEGIDSRMPIVVKHRP